MDKITIFLTLYIGHQRDRQRRRLAQAPLAATVLGPRKTHDGRESAATSLHKRRPSALPFMHVQLLFAHSCRFAVQQQSWARIGLHLRRHGREILQYLLCQGVHSQVAHQYESEELRAFVHKSEFAVVQDFCTVSESFVVVFLGKVSNALIYLLIFCVFLDLK